MTLSLSNVDPLFLHVHEMWEKVNTRLISSQLEMEECRFPISLLMLESASELRLSVILHRPSSFSLYLFDNNGT